MQKHLLTEPNKRIEPLATALSFYFWEVIDIHEEAAIKIIRYMDECLFEPEQNWDRYQFEKRSYERWAAIELMENILDRPTESPELVAEEFILKMRIYFSIADDVNVNIIFQTAIQTAEDILGLL